MPTFQDYQPHVSDLDSDYQQLLQQKLSGELGGAQQQYIQQEAARQKAQQAEMYGAQGAPSGAAQAAQTRLSGDIAMRAALMSGQQQMQGLQYGMPYMQHQAQQYWMPQQMEQQRYQLQQQYADPPWYEQALGYFGGLAGDIVAPWAAGKFLGRGGGAQPTSEIDELVKNLPAKPAMP